MRPAAHRSCLIVLLVGLALLPSLPALAQTASPPAAAAVSLPDTPAGQRFGAWLAAVNSGKRETLRQFIADSFALSSSACVSSLRFMPWSSAMTKTQKAPSAPASVGVAQPNSML